MLLRVLPAVVLLAAAAGPARADREARLAGGEILTRVVDVPGSDAPKAQAWGVVDAPPAAVWAVIEDCARYAGTLPRVGKSELVRREGSHFFCRVSIDMPFPISDLWSVTDAVHVVGPPKWSRTWRFVEGTYTTNEGGWKLTAFGPGGARTLVEYWVHAEPETAIPGFVQRLAQEKSLPGVIEAVRAAVRKR